MPKAKAPKALERLELEIVPVQSIKPNSYNPNRQDPEIFEMLKRSITDDGFLEPVIVQRSSREIVDGEHRWRAAQALGMSELPVVFVEMTPEQMRIATLRHNRARGDEDVDLTANLLRDLQSLEASLVTCEALGMKESELNALLSDAEKEVEKLLDFTAPSPQAPLPQASSPNVQTPRAPAERPPLPGVVAPNLTQQVQPSTARLLLTYTGDDASVVREVLNPNPSAQFLKLCRLEIEGQI